MIDRLHSAKLTLCRDLAAAGVALPAEVADALDHAQGLRRRSAQLPSTKASVSAAAMLLAEDPDADIDDELDAAVRAEVLDRVFAHAIDRAHWRAASAVTRCHQQIIDAINATLFVPASATVVAAAKVTTADDTPAGLLTQGRVDDAALLADAARAADTLDRAVQLRNRVYGGAAAGIERLLCDRWTDWFAVADAVRGRTGADYWLAGVRAGGTPWLGSLPDVEDRSRQLDREHGVPA